MRYTGSLVLVLAVLSASDQASAILGTHAGEVAAMETTAKLPVVELPCASRSAPVNVQFGDRALVAYRYMDALNTWTRR